MPIRILIVANTGWYVNNFRRSTILAFLARGDYVAVICPENTSEELLEDLDVQVKTFPLDGAGTNPLVELRSLFSIILAVKTLSADVVFMSNSNLNSALRMAQFVPQARNTKGVEGTVASHAHSPS